MQTELIETFLDLCETRSFNRTADRMGVTQSTISGRIQALEGLLGRRLFTRSRAGTQLTTEGLRFEPHARSLRHGWAEALAAMRAMGTAPATLRIGIQHDLTINLIGSWVRDFRAAIPDTAFYIEADYSPAMSSDLVTGGLDLAMMYTARSHPDLYFETLGEITYRMVSTETGVLAQVRPETFIMTSYSPAFEHSLADLHPALRGAGVATGQSTAVVGLLSSLGGTAYLLEDLARQLVAAGTAHWVADAAPIPQTVFAGVHLRHRHRAAHRRMLGLLRAYFARSDAPGRRRVRATGVVTGQI